MKNDEYYVKSLSAARLKRCYDLASPRIQQYLNAEIKFVQEYIRDNFKVLELGCGYGRVMKKLAKSAKKVVGIDNSQESLNFAKKYLKRCQNCELFEMDVKELTFEDNSFDLIIAIQNGISAFKVKPEIMILESLRVLKVGRKLILSSYSDKIWAERIKWFEAQANEGLVGEIDHQKTNDGTIVCKDGFKATTFTKKDFRKLAEKLNLDAVIKEIDNSSIFCVITKK